MMRSPVLAILWETWRLTRLEAAVRMSLGLVAASAMMVALASAAPGQAAREFGVAIALVLLIAPTFPAWFSITSLKGGRNGGFGFPFFLHYTRPVRTALLVGVPMAYLATLAAALYMVPALVWRWAFDAPFPVLPIAASIAVLHLAQAAADWSTRSWTVGFFGVSAATIGFMSWIGMRGGAFEWSRGLKADPFRRWPAQFDFSLAEYAALGAVALASFAVAIGGVARQRHDYARTGTVWKLEPGRFPNWLVTAFRFPCPTASATRAQTWFELKSRGLPVLTIGVALALVIPLLFAVSVSFERFRPIALTAGMASVLGVLALGGNAFGIQRSQGRVYASAFETTRAYGTAGMAALKVLVRSVCVLAAFAAVTTSVWASLAFIAVGDRYEPLRSWQQAGEAVIGVLSVSQLAALAVVLCIGMAVMIAARAALGALWVRYPRGMQIAGSLLLLQALMLVPLAITSYRGTGSAEQALREVLLNALVWMTRWIDAPAIVVATACVSWRVLAERLLTLRSVAVAVLASAAFGAAWVTLLRAAGVHLAAMSTMDAIWLLSPVLLPLLASVLAPWSLSCIRHT